jgi:hypothetical protein
MGATTGMTAIGAYNGVIDSDIDTLLSLIPNPDAPHGTGAVGGGNQGILNTYLDEMSPGAAAQIRVELEALQSAAPIAYGQYVVTAGDAAANHADIVTGLADLTLANCAATVRRAGTDVTVDAVLSEPVAGTLRVADGGTTYNVTAGDVITWAAK